MSRSFDRGACHSAPDNRTVSSRCRHIAGPVLCALLLTAAATGAHADDIRVFSGGAPQQPLQTLVPEFEQSSGHKVHFTFALVTSLQQKLAAGEKADLILLPVPLIAATEKTLPLQAEGRVVLARVGIGVIVREGARLPDVSTPDAVRALLLDARSVAFPHPSTPSGAHLTRMIEGLGIADAVQPKVTIRPAIDGGAGLVANGEAEVGMYLLSEVQSARGVSVAGLLPPDLQSWVVYGTAVPAYNPRPEPAVALVKFISQPGKADVWTAAGFELK